MLISRFKKRFMITYVKLVWIFMVFVLLWNQAWIGFHNNNNILLIMFCLSLEKRQHKTLLGFILLLTIRNLLQEKLLKLQTSPLQWILNLIILQYFRHLKQHKMTLIKCFGSWALVILQNFLQKWKQLRLVPYIQLKL